MTAEAFTELSARSAALRAKQEQLLHLIRARQRPLLAVLREAKPMEL